ncbi:MAG TPA: DNRLRE domain-containing protein, partial [Anaerolineae bacterium]
DRYATELGSGSVGDNPSVGSYVTLTLSASQVQDWVDGTVTNSGLLLQVDTESNDMVGYYSREHALFPTLSVTYTTGSAQMTAVADTSMLDTNPTTNYGSATSLLIGEDNSAAAVRRGLLKFDLSWLSHVDGTVTGAALLLTIDGDQSSNTRTFRAYQARRAWVEGTATWNDYDTGGAWTTAGAGSTVSDRYATELGSASIAADAPLEATIVIPLTASMVQDWVDGDVTNNGIIIQADTENADLWSFYSSETGTSHWNTLPTLIVDYSANVGSFAEGSSISSGSITASDGGGSTISGLTIGDWYGIETSGGPWESGSGSEYDIALSNDAGTTWVLSETGNWISWVENTGNYERIFFKATTTSVKVRAQDYAFGDNSGTIDYTLYDGTMAQNLPVWQIGNYLIDGSAESWPYLNYPPYFPWSVSSMFDVTRQTTWTYGGDTAPMCNQNFAVLRASLNSPSYIEQEFMFDGGDMFITLGLRTQGSAQIIVQLKDPFDQWHVVESFITNGASNWKAFNYLRADQWLGKYTLRITAFSMGAQSFAAVDGLSVGEGWYQPCTYNGTVLTPPDAMPGTLVEKSIPDAETEEGNALTGGTFEVDESAWYIPPFAMIQLSPTTSNHYLDLGVAIVDESTVDPIVYENILRSKNWIEIRPNAAVAKGFAATLAKMVVDSEIYLSAQMAFSGQYQAAIFTEMEHEIYLPFQMENIETGVMYDMNYFNSQPGAPSVIDQLVFGRMYFKVSVPPGRYRLVTRATSREVAYEMFLDNICVGPKYILALEDCTDADLLTDPSIPVNSAYLTQQAQSVQDTAVAAQTALAIQTGVAGTQIVQAQATQ